MKPFGNLDYSFPFEDEKSFYEKFGSTKSGRVHVIPVRSTISNYERYHSSPRSHHNFDHYEHHHHNHQRLVYVTFHTHKDKKMVEMYLDENRALEQVAAKAEKLLPDLRWKIFEGTSTQIGNQFTTSHQVWNAITFNPILGYHYLSVRQIRDDSEGVKCNQCRRIINGHRFKCTQCSDYDICSKCEAKGVHSQHAMLRLVGGACEIPRYIIDNAPKFVFHGYLF